ncbi:MAG: hypothetical protein ISR82_07290, partial [Candidatus Marinimicrobia bacterium]|nr:hypothetical protein [Candidatus Neomarinimicrobiota bacterium]
MKKYPLLFLAIIVGLFSGCGPKPAPKPVEKTTAYFDKSLYPGETVNVNGIDIYYEKKGSGPYLILIEGLGVETWLY